MHEIHILKILQKHDSKYERCIIRRLPITKNYKRKTNVSNVKQPKKIFNFFKIILQGVNLVKGT